MPTYARVENEAVVEVREIDVIPAHKASLWRPYAVEGDGPNETTVIESDKVRVLRSVDLPALKSELKSRVDADAEAIRLRYITPGAGMAMTYDEKHAQARAVHDLGEAAANALSEQDRIAQFPTLAASVGLEAATLWACAQLVIAKYEAFADLAYTIERTRLAGKKSISDASDAAAARAAYEAITWQV